MTRANQRRPDVNISDTTNNAIGSAEDQIARLRNQVEALMKDRVTPMVTNAAGRAEAALHSASDSVRHQADNVSGRVRQQPLIAVAVAAGVGFLIGRFIK
jgi:ElaB/YqjD/DUF883 family membrane-anchored ribosome-binding protein